MTADRLDQLHHCLLWHAITLGRGHSDAAFKKHNCFVFPSCFDERFAAELERFAHLRVELDAFLKTHRRICEATRLQVRISKAEVCHFVGRIGGGHLLKLCNAVGVHGATIVVNLPRPVHRSRIAKSLEVALVKAEVVSDLVQHRDPNLFANTRFTAVRAFFIFRLIPSARGIDDAFAKHMNDI